LKKSYNDQGVTLPYNLAETSRQVKGQGPFHQGVDFALGWENCETSQLASVVI
jgi:hypothetical protein